MDAGPYAGEVGEYVGLVGEYNDPGGKKLICMIDRAPEQEARLSSY